MVREADEFECGTRMRDATQESARQPSSVSSLTESAGLYTRSDTLSQTKAVKIEYLIQRIQKPHMPLQVHAQQVLLTAGQRSV